MEPLSQAHRQRVVAATDAQESDSECSISQRVVRSPSTSRSWQYARERAFGLQSCPPARCKCLMMFRMRPAISNASTAGTFDNRADVCATACPHLQGRGQASNVAHCHAAHCACDPARRTRLPCLSMNSFAATRETAHLRPACFASMAIRAPRRPVVLVCWPLTRRPQKCRRPLHDAAHIMLHDAAHMNDRGNSNSSQERHRDAATSKLLVLQAMVSHSMQAQAHSLTGSPTASTPWRPHKCTC